MATSTGQGEKIYARQAGMGCRNSLDDKMEAIAGGVRARLGEGTDFSGRVTEETVKTARALGIAELVIQKWAARRRARQALEKERLREIRSLLVRVYGGRSDAAAV
jgi:hypothetical protein